jgi:DNA-directed RNA polymerase specialized sigma24 family protein
MWPDDFEDWMEQIPFTALFQRTRGRLWHYPVLQREAGAIAYAACERAVECAGERRQWPGYFAGPAYFRGWLFTVAYREALRRVLDARDVRNCLRQLGPEDRQLLYWHYVDQFTAPRLAMILWGASPPPQRVTDAQNRVEQAYDRFVHVLVENGWGRDDWTFPR